MSQLHFRVFTYAIETSESFIAESTYRYSSQPHSTQKTLEIAKSDLHAELHEGSCLIAASYLGLMTKEEFLEHSEPINTKDESDQEYCYYLLVFRSVNGTKSAIISKKLPFISLPIIKKVQSMINMVDCPLVNVEFLTQTSQRNFLHVESQQR